MNLSLAGGGVSGQPLFSSSATQYHPPGTLGYTKDGRVHRYAKAGAVALVAGNMIQAPAQVTTHDQLTTVAAAVGDLTLVATLDATNNAAANQYAGGLAIIDTTPGEGYAYPISGHAAAALSTNITLALDPGGAIQVALTTSSKTTLTPNPFRGVIQSPVTTLTGAVCGACVYPVAITEWGWLQVRGQAAVLVAGTPGVGLAVVVPGTAAGCVVVDGAAAATPVVGTMMVTGVDGKILPVLLNLP